MQAKTEVRKAVGRDELTDASEEFLNELEAEMLKAAENLEFERAATLRDRIIKLRSEQSGGPARPLPTPQATSAAPRPKPVAASAANAGRNLNEFASTPLSQIMPEPLDSIARRYPDFDPAAR